MLQNIGIGGQGVLSGDVLVYEKNVLVDNLFTAWALTENIFPAIPWHEYIFIFNIFPAIPWHEYIFIFKSSACSLDKCFINY